MTDDTAASINVETFAAGLRDTILRCRELGHVWRPNTVSWDKKAKAYDRRLRCSSCRTIRVQLLDESGHIVSNRYIYSDGYLATNVEMPRYGTRDVFRKEAIVRFLEGNVKALTPVAS